MIGLDFEKAVVSLVCWNQMKGEQYRGMVSLAMMLRNRARANWFDGSIYLNAVALSKESKIEMDYPDAREPQFLALLQAMDGIFSDTVPDKTGDAMYCAHVSSQEAIVGEITTQVGQFIFFRGPK